MLTSSCVLPLPKRGAKKLMEKFVRRVGSADIIYKKQRGAITVVFGEKGDFPLLGVTALEAVGLILDPVQRKLKPVALTA